jgi:pimeloyl-ACP methyl ester carboxylesterase
MGERGVGKLERSETDAGDAGPRPTVWLYTAVWLALSPLVANAQEPGGRYLELPQIVERGELGPHLLLIPCAGCGAASWTAFMEANADRFRMTAVTLPGYAGSPRPDLPLWTGDTVFQDNAVEQLIRLLDERGLREVVVVGQSFGSLIGLRLAAARPDVVEVLVNVDGSPVNPPSRASSPPEERLAEARARVDEAWALRLQDPEQFRRFNAATRQPTVEQRTLHHGMFMASDRVSMLHYWRENVLRDRNTDFRALQASYLDIKALFPWDPRPDSTLAAHVQSISAVGTPARYERVVFHDTSPPATPKGTRYGDPRSSRGSAPP